MILCANKSGFYKSQLGWMGDSMWVRWDWLWQEIYMKLKWKPAFFSFFFDLYIFQCESITYAFQPKTSSVSLYYSFIFCCSEYRSEPKSQLPVYVQEVRIFSHKNKVSQLYYNLFMSHLKYDRMKMNDPEECLSLCYVTFSFNNTHGCVGMGQ